MTSIRVEIVSAEEALWSGEGTMVFVPGELGEMGISPMHAPLLSRLKPGDVRVQKENGEEEFFFVSGGLLEIQPHQVTILSDTAIRAQDLDESKALEAQQRAERDLREKKSTMELAKAKAELVQAAAELRALEKLRKSSKRRH